MDFVWIDTIDGLKTMATRLSVEALLSCDLEADSMHHYREKVCLLQVSVPGACFIVDTLACVNLAPIASIFRDASRRKLFHGADYDVRSLHRDFGIEIDNLFDTMVACQFLGEQEVGLAALLRKRFGVELDKRYQQADWSRRPIPPEMLDYALKDVTLLIPLYLQLEEELRAKGRLEGVLEECALLEKVRVTERKDESLLLKFKGASRMAPESLAVLDELLRFREMEAERRDVPPFKVLANETLRALAEHKPQTLEALQGTTGFSARLIERYGPRVLSVIDNVGRRAPCDFPCVPVKPRPKRRPDQEERLRRLKAWREVKAAEIGLAPGLLANNALLEMLADSGMPAGLHGFKEWQGRLFGEELVRLLP
jgi:ribonuclease D